MKESVLVVSPGNYYATTIGTALGSFSKKKEIVAKIKFSKNAAEYLFDPTDPNGKSYSYLFDS